MPSLNCSFPKKLFRELVYLLRTLPYKLNHRIYSLIHGNAQKYLDDVTGVIHIGASTGQERDLYNSHDLNVIWIEALPDIFDSLQANVCGYPRQLALNYLADQYNDEEVAFHVANNNGESSSLLEMVDHSLMYPDVSSTSSISLSTRTLDWIVMTESIDLDLYDAMVLDVQGAEMRVLKGAAMVLIRMRYIEVEVADFISYSSSPLLSDMSSFMSVCGFTLHYLQRTSFVPGVGTYYNAIYKRVRS